MPSKSSLDHSVQTFLDELHERVADKVVRDVAELPDRTSPADQPGMSKVYGRGGAAYETVAEIDGLKYEVVDTGKVGLFGEPIFHACTFQEVMRSTMSRNTLGTYSTRAEALAKIKHVLSANDQ